MEEGHFSSMEEGHSFQQRLLRADGVAQAIDSLPSKHEALSSAQNQKRELKQLDIYKQKKKRKRKKR
jgi:hypothetical protein